MNSSSKIDKPKYYSGCNKYYSPNLFINDLKTFRTCNTCHNQNSQVKKNKNKHSKNNNQIIFDLSDFNDHIIETIGFLEINKAIKDQENFNFSEFKFSCSINISILEGDSKEKLVELLK
ncbi:4780_t:CDS:1 [Dentiscutata erythropus]|uniref:4780_t:CDS:1 n=1 Tax=Dentiscutata erythropus TaxID=1348616 RepID=A0A9N9D8A8_9GLOM|nr:4780_t:CDS:1 [Dentiscutata erythropus]